MKNIIIYEWEKVRIQKIKESQIFKTRYKEQRSMKSNWKYHKGLIRKWIRDNNSK